jgi:uncharacterized protein (DUF736 family)
MATLGTFKKQDDGTFTGAIKTLTLDLKKVTFRTAEKTKPKSPDFRVFAGETDIGAAWKETSKQDREWLSVKLDDPSFAAPIFAGLHELDDGYSLIWSRRDPSKKDESDAEKTSD